ncbi:hypothetical protein SteCoe_37218 [Stentor coeruleus]|uniref:RING-type domain-containing protein n=1 Tax=Stentor coeruleus TaxID=5963 RepID=A0A1R2ANT4_9CILI|nr:hypothetical protein SteCoe_37218 [Stentor coeruleus]
MIPLALGFLIILSSSCSIDNCEFCSPKSSQICLNCNLGYIRDEFEGCRISDINPAEFRIENCEVLSETTCAKCSEGYILLSGRCDPICESENCLCFSPETCLHIERSLGCGDSYCKLCDENALQCTQCDQGFGLDYDNYCVLCEDQNCKDCGTDYQVCNSCFDGYYYFEEDKTCYQCYSDGCATCDSNDPSICNACYEGYHFDSNSYCCNNSCLTCFYDSSNCQECPEGMYLDYIYCYYCPDNCISCEDQNYCNKCEEGYELNDNNECVELWCNLRDCITCEYFKDQCTECISGMYIDAYFTNCCGMSCRTCSSDDGFVCLTCYEGTYLDDEDCYDCQEGCESCDSEYNCFSCRDGYSFSDGECTKNHSKSDSSLAVKIAVPISLVALVIIIILTILCIRRKRLRLHKLQKKMDKTQTIPSDVHVNSNPIVITPNQPINNVPQPVPITYSQAPISSYQQYAYPNNPAPATFSPVYQYNNPSQANPNIQNPPVGYSQPYNNPSQANPNIQNPPVGYSQPYNNPSQVNPNIQNPPVGYSQPYNNNGITQGYNGLTVIDHLNFTTLVQVVQLDSERAYNGIKLCMVCNEKFDMNPDIRALPCGHPYHGKCIYNHMVVGGRKQCLHCLRQYA